MYLISLVELFMQLSAKTVIFYLFVNMQKQLVYNNSTSNCLIEYFNKNLHTSLDKIELEYQETFFFCVPNNPINQNKLLVCQL